MFCVMVCLLVEFFVSCVGRDWVSSGADSSVAINLPVKRRPFFVGNW
jgi:hypothetical protein